MDLSLGNLYEDEGAGEGDARFIVAVPCAFCNGLIKMYSTCPCR